MPTPQPTAARPVPATPKPASPRFWGGWLLALVLVAQAWGATRLFPSLGSIVDPRSPVLVVDHAIHEYHGALGAKFLGASATTWGYDPFFMAGYPETPVWDSSSNLAIAFNAFGALLGGGPPSFRAYKVGLFAVSILGVLALALGARGAGAGWAEAAVAAGLAAVYFWVGFPMSLWRSGLFAFLTAAISAPLLLGLCVRFDRQPGRLGWLALALAGGGAVLYPRHGADSGRGRGAGVLRSHPGDAAARAPLAPGDPRRGRGDGRAEPRLAGRALAVPGAPGRLGIIPDDRLGAVPDRVLPEDAGRPAFRPDPGGQPARRAEAG